MTTRLPVLDPRRCRAHHACVAVCPTRCLEPLPSGVWMPRPGDCAACGACVAVCPESALTLIDATAETNEEGA